MQIVQSYCFQVATFLLVTQEFIRKSHKIDKIGVLSFLNGPCFFDTFSSFTLPFRLYFFVHVCSPFLSLSFSSLSPSLFSLVYFFVFLLIYSLFFYCFLILLFISFLSVWISSFLLLLPLSFFLRNLSSLVLPLFLLFFSHSYLFIICLTLLFLNL